ncbi:MAG: hypothetical protein M0D55_15560 [Elusimicrobiota bacterium]|nr:MAG: hypothetical protein M0D55_15560 [Elusimicrobiota bacterium]
MDFGAKTLGGGGSQSQISLTSPAGVTHNVNSFSYAGFSGDASVNLAPHMAGSNWTGTTLKLSTVGGVTAGAASIDVRWDTGFGTKYGGPVSGTLGSAP